MPKPISVASGTTDVQAITGGATVHGVTVIGTTAAKVYLRDGTTASDPIIAAVQLTTSSGTVHVPVPATTCNTGVFVDRDGTNACELVIYLGG